MFDCWWLVQYWKRKGNFKRETKWDFVFQKPTQNFGSELSLEWFSRHRELYPVNWQPPFLQPNIWYNRELWNPETGLFLSERFEDNRWKIYRQNFTKYSNVRWQITSVDFATQEFRYFFTYLTVRFRFWYD